MAAPLGSFARLNLFGSKPPTAASSSTLFYSVAGLSVSKTAMQHRAVTQVASVATASIPIASAAPTGVATPASVAPTFATAQPPPAPVSTVIVTTSILAPIPLTTTSTATPITATAVYTTVTQFLTTIPTSTPEASFTTPPGTTSVALASITPVGATNLEHSTSSSRSSSFSRSSAARASASSLRSSYPSPHKKSNTGKYVGYAIGAVFFLTLISSFFSAYRKHRKFIRRRPRGSIFTGAGLSSVQDSPQKRSMAQALMRSVSNRSFDAYALADTPPTSPAPAYHSELMNRPRGFSPSPIHIRPLPPTPSPKYATHEDGVFYPHVPPVDPREYSPYSPFGASSSGSSTQTRDPR